jgi:hypothetical protein
VPVHLLEYVYPDGRIERKPAEYVDGEMIRTGVVFISDDGADWIVQTVLPHNRYAAKIVLRKPNDSRLSDASSPQRLAVHPGGYSGTRGQRCKVALPPIRHQIPETAEHLAYRHD